MTSALVIQMPICLSTVSPIARGSYETRFVAIVPVERAHCADQHSDKPDKQIRRRKRNTIHISISAPGLAMFDGEISIVSPYPGDRRRTPIQQLIGRY
jgi:hypothetical protein